MVLCVKWTRDDMSVHEEEEAHFSLPTRGDNPMITAARADLTC